MEYTIRAFREREYPLLEDFLYEAIFIPEGAAPPPRDIVYQPELQVYVEGFGSRDGDISLCAESCGRIVGAVWGRIMNDYGHIDDGTPSLAISLYKEYRGQGIGTALMRAVIEAYRDAGYKRLSLAVQKANYAVKLYKKSGFKTVLENDEEYIMLCEW
ncbi:GNAT family N-acetyltransferase [Ruminococcus sp.]|uniref:GNAT family N-acetyltransferase n=1 Tax=Ruminococcus sp. TaxID=41978 RepID=UPI0025FBDD9D|nr:GNAT family N-acetyltransferase [Ruminococcus sp.]MCR4639096.1 GNAT family N-acetyltransferase [Ruminococcus sp.]